MRSYVPVLYVPDDKDMLCPGCGYNLRGLPGNPRCCPECGRWAELVMVVGSHRWPRLQRLRRPRTRTVAWGRVVALVIAGCWLACLLIAWWLW